MNSAARRVTLNSLAFLAARVIDMVAGVLTVVLVARYLGVKDFGDYSFITALVGFLVSITYFGLERVAIREISRSRDAANKCLGGILVVRWALSSLVVLFIAVYLAFSSLPGRTILAMSIVTASELIWASGSVFSCTFKAFEKMHLETITTFIYRMVTLALIGIVVYCKGDMLLLFVALCCGNIVRTIVAIYYSNSLTVKPLIRVDFPLWRSYAKEAFILGIVVILALGTFRTGIFVLKYMKSATDVALLQSAQTVVMQMQVLPLSIGMALFPMLSQLSVSSREKLGIVSGTVLKYLFILSVPLAIIVFIFSETIIRIVFGREFAPASPILGTMAWCIIPLFLSSLMEFVLISMNRQKDAAISWAVAFVVNILLNFILIRAYGVQGAATAVLVSFILLCLVQYFYLVYHLNIGELSGTIVRLLIPLALVIIFLYWFSGGGLYHQFVGAMSAIIIFVAALFSAATVSISEIKSFARLGRPGL